MKWLAMSRVFRLGSILKFAVPAAAVFAAAAFWAGQQWQSGRHAQQELRETRQQQVEQVRVIEHQRQEAAGYEARREQRREAARISDRDLRAFVDRHPDLWDCDIGDDGLRLIRSWDRAAADPAESFDPVSDSDAKPGHRPGTRSAREQEGSN